MTTVALLRAKFELQNRIEKSKLEGLEDLKEILKSSENITELADNLEQFLADKWKKLNSNILTRNFYTNYPNDEETQLMLSVAKFVAAEKETRPPKYSFDF